jgi:hypothetical protein
MPFLPNPRFPLEMAKDAVLVAQLASAAKGAEENAKALAPVREGDYRDGIEVVVEGSEVALVGTYWTSHFLEFGTVDTPAFAPLRRGVRAAGLRLKEDT